MQRRHADPLHCTNCAPERGHEIGVDVLADDAVCGRARWRVSPRFPLGSACRLIVAIWWVAGGNDRDHRGDAMSKGAWALAAMLTLSGWGNSALAERSVNEGEQIVPTLIYVTPPEPSGLRAVLELQAVFLTGFLYYLSTSGLNQDWDLNYEWEIFERKLTGQSFGADFNHFGTNFIGHPLGGAGYYHAARSNQFGVYQSAAFSFGGSFLWEYFGELREVISMNDTLVTPMAGWAIGESLFQLGSFFDRSGPEWHNRVLGTLFSPMKSANDWMDGAELKRVRSGFPTNEWHEFDLQAGAAVVLEDGNAGSTANEVAEARIRLQERIVRLPHFDDAGHHSLAFGNAELSRMRLDLAFAEAGLSNLVFDAEVVLAGYYFRDANAGSSGLWGAGGVLGVGCGFEYSVRDLRRTEPGRLDRVSTVEPILLFSEYRAHLGEVNFLSSVDLGPSFGGLTAHALRGYSGEVERLPYVAQLRGYYFGLGGYGRASLGLGYRALTLGAEGIAQGYRAVDSPGERVNVRIADTRAVLASFVGYDIPDSAARLRLHHELRRRASSVASDHVFRTESSLGLSLAAVF